MDKHTFYTLRYYFAELAAWTLVLLLFAFGAYGVYQLLF